MIGNPNFKRDRSESLRRAINEGCGEFKANSRYRGTTTGIALETIGKALQNPGQPIPIEDHILVDAGKCMLIETIRSAILDLGLVGLEVRTGKRASLTYTLEYVYGPK
jgi:hypothetical protein